MEPGHFLQCNMRWDRLVEPSYFAFIYALHLKLTCSL